VDASRQRRTIRLVQILLVLISAGLLMFAGYSFGRVSGYRSARSGAVFERPRPPSPAQPIVLTILGGIAIAGAAALQQGSSVRMPTPARLDELAGRAEQTALERAEKAEEAEKA